MKHILILAAAALGLTACDMDVHTPAGSGSSTTVVTPGTEKKVENNTTIVKPEAPSATKTETSTSVSPSGTTSSTTTTKQQ